MKKTDTLKIVVLTAFLGAQANAATVDAELASAWMTGDAGTYFEIQGDLLDVGEGVYVWSDEVLGAFDYDHQTWARLVVAEATALRAKISREVDRLYGLQGLRSENYLKWRRPEPAVLRELKGLPHLVASMMELYHVGMASYPWSGAAYEESERLALQTGLLHAIGESQHPARVHFLADVLESRFDSRAIRLSAISALAKTGQPEALLVLDSLIAESQNDVEFRAWIAGSLGHIRMHDTWDLLQGFLADSSPKVKKAALASVRLLVSRWHWDGRAAELGQLRQEITPILVRLLEDERPELEHQRIGETLSLVGGSLVVDSLKKRVHDKSLTVDIRSRFTSALQLVERAERRRH